MRLNYDVLSLFKSFALTCGMSGFGFSVSDNFRYIFKQRTLAPGKIFPNTLQFWTYFKFNMFDNMKNEKCLRIIYNNKTASCEEFLTKGDSFSMRHKLVVKKL